MTVYSQSGLGSDDPKLQVFHDSRITPIQVRCIKDNPPMRGFGRTLKIGDVITINGTVSEGTTFQVACPAECAFYDYEYFEKV